jgi:sugar lactone lactonase YvrE
MYRVATVWLRDASVHPRQIAGHVQRVGEAGASDGIMFGPDGNLYLTSLEFNAIRRITIRGDLELVCRDPRLNWPDSFAVGPDGFMYVTTSQIHLWGNAPEPYRILKFRP